MLSFFSSLPGAVAQGAIWGIMAVGVFITYKILDLADLTVDGSFGTGGAVLVVCTASGMNIYLAMILSLLAGCAAGFVTGVLHTKFVVSNGIVALSGGLLAQYQGFADVNMGRGAIVIGLAAIIIGDVVFGKIFKNFALKLLGAVLGGVIYYIVITFFLCLGLPANDLKMLTAAVVALFLGVPYWKGKLAEKRVKPAEEVKADA